MTPAAAPGPHLAGRALCLIGGLSLLLVAGCTAGGEESLPPGDQFFFPTGMALSPDESVLFVGNANSALAWNSGAVMVVDLDDVESLLGPWLQSRELQAGADCEVDLAFRDILQCNEKLFINGEAGVRIGNFSTDIGVQELDSGNLRLFVAVRGDPSVTWIDYKNERKELECRDKDMVPHKGAIPLCDGPNRLMDMRRDVELGQLVSEPFNVYVDSVHHYVLVTHLLNGAVTLVDTPPNDIPIPDPNQSAEAIIRPVLADRVTGLFEADPNTGLRGAVGVAGRQPGSEADLVYVTSRSEKRVQMLYVFRPADATLHPSLLRSEYFFLDGVNASSDSRGIAFNDDGSRAYIANRDPPTLQIIDTELDEQGFPRNRFAGAVELCRDAANLVVADLGEGDRVYVTCFTSGQVWVIDPRAGIVEATITVGRGPHALALARERRRLYVGNFLEDTIAVIDLTPGAATENRMVMRLGRTRQTGGN